MSTSTNTSQRKSSMSMADLEAIHEERTMSTATPSPPVDLNVDIFQEICQDVEQEDMTPIQKTKKMSRRASLCQDEDDVVDPTAVNTLPTATRRHSGYESRMRREFRESHADAKEYLATTPHAERRASFVNSMLEFNLSLSMSHVDVDPSRAAAMQLSCPVLSYMNDEEEDSVELRMMKRPSMTYVGEEDESQCSWEALEEGDSNNNNMQEGSSREYVIELPPLEELAPKKRRRRKPHSYKVLEQQLNEQSPLEVMKQFNESFQMMPQQNDVMPSRPAVAAAMPQPPKTLEHDLRHVLASPPPQQPMAASRPATARGA